MLEILNGREHFYQWDANQKLVIDDDVVKEVHYDNGTGDALVCGVYDLDGVRVADVPNILLQTYWDIKVYAACEDCVRYARTIKVEKRNRPDDYVYTETNIKRYEDLEKRIEKLETYGGNNGGVLSINGKMGVVELTANDVGALPNTTVIPVIPSNVSAFNNDAGYLKQSSLTGYYTKAETEAAINSVKPDLTPYAKKTEIADMATKTYVNNAISAIPKTNLDNYYTKGETNTAINNALMPYAKKADLPSIDGLASEEYVDNAVSSLTNIDLSNYYTKTETEDIVEQQAAAALEDIESNYYNKQQIDENTVEALKPYAKKTEIPSINGLATETYVNNAVAAIPKTDLSNYYTKSETNTAINNAKPDLSNYYTKTETNTAISNAKPDLTPYAKKAEIPDVSGFIKQSELNVAVENALEEAKQSGEFKGEKGEDGYTPVKGVDYFDGAKGDTGAAGVGVSSIKQTTTSTADDGNNVITVSLTNGTTSTFTIQNGSKGSTGEAGAAGYTPVRGTDYWTAADIATIKNYVDDAILGGAW